MPAARWLILGIEKTFTIFQFSPGWHGQVVMISRIGSAQPLIADRLNSVQPLPSCVTIDVTALQSS